VLTQDALSRRLKAAIPHHLTRYRALGVNFSPTDPVSLEPLGNANSIKSKTASKTIDDIKRLVGCSRSAQLRKLPVLSPRWSTRNPDRNKCQFVPQFGVHRPTDHRHLVSRGDQTASQVGTVPFRPTSPQRAVILDQCDSHETLRCMIFGSIEGRRHRFVQTNFAARQPLTTSIHRIVRFEMCRTVWAMIVKPVGCGSAARTGMVSKGQRC